jgi:hypothetical protein
VNGRHINTEKLLAKLDTASKKFWINCASRLELMALWDADLKG